MCRLTGRISNYKRCQRVVQRGCDFIRYESESPSKPRLAIDHLSTNIQLDHSLHSVKQSSPSYVAASRVIQQFFTDCHSVEILPGGEEKKKSEEETCGFSKADLDSVLRIHTQASKAMITILFCHPMKNNSIDCSKSISSFKGD